MAFTFDLLYMGKHLFVKPWLVRASPGLEKHLFCMLSEWYMYTYTLNFQAKS